MDVQAYIESGVLELYVSGALTEQEMREVERMAHQYPAIKQELDEIENSFFEMANELHTGPRASLKDELLKNVKMSVTGTTQKNIVSEKVVVNSELVEQKEETAKVINLPKKKSNTYKYALAASLALLIASTSTLLVVYNSLTNTEEKLVDLQTKYNESTTRLASLKTSYDESQNMIGSLRAADVQKLKLDGLAISPESEAMVHWDKATKKVILDPMNLPRTDETHDYQLWAIVDGKPVDLGTFSPGDNELNIYLMKSIEAPQAFAITLEPKGGSENPTMEQMYVMGKI